MPTSITVPVAQRTKSIRFGAPYSPATTFNPDKELLTGCSGILSGMTVTVNEVPNPDEVTVGVGAFIQRGIIVELTSSQLVQVPNPTVYPLYLVAENQNEVSNSPVQILFTQTPAADSVILAEWPTGPIFQTSFPERPVNPLRFSNCALRDAIENLNKLVIQRDEQVAGALQTVFTLPAEKAYVIGANKLSVYRNGKKLTVVNEYAETNTTTVTLANPATAGDVLEFIIFKSEPPITSLSLNDLTDMTSTLREAILDILSIRVAPATASNPLATIADVLANVGGGGGAAALQKEEVSTTAPFSTASGAFVAVTGTNLAFTLTESKVVFFIAQGPLECTGGGASAYEAGINIDAVNYSLQKWETAAIDTVDSLYCWKAVLLNAGAHNASIVIRKAGGAENASIPASAAAPCTLLALYTVPVFGVGSLTKVEAISQAGGDFSAGDSFATVPNSTINFTLNSTQTVFFSGYGSSNDDGGALTNSQIGLRVDGVDYPGSISSTQNLGTGAVGGMTVSRALSLGPGAHTASLRLRREDSGDPASARIYTSSARPAVLTALYTDPQALAVSQVVEAFDAASGTFETSSGSDTTIPAPIVNFNQLVTGPVEVHLTGALLAGAGGSGQGLSARFGVILDGVTVRVLSRRFADLEGNDPVAGSTVFPSVAPGAHTIQATLAYTGGGFTTSARMARNGDQPLRLVVRHT